MSLMEPGAEASQPIEALAPFDLWEERTSALSFGVGEELPVTPVWSLSLSSAAPDGQAALAQRAGQLRALDSGLEQAGPRLERFLRQQAGDRQAGGQPDAGQQAAVGDVSFAAPSADSLFPDQTAESSLSAALQVIQGAGAPGEASFGAGEAFPVELNWEDLRAGFDRLVDQVNRQILHAAWVETLLDGQLAARTTVTWGGDMQTVLRPGLPRATAAAHMQSISLAMASRAANLRTVLTVAALAAQLAAKLASIGTPLGALQALALTWHFVKHVIRP